MITKAYILGVLTIPAVWFVCAVLWAALRPAERCTTRCVERCPVRYELRPKRFEPWWVWTQRSHLAWRRHLKVSEPCRAKINQKLERFDNRRRQWITRKHWPFVVEGSLKRRSF